MNFHSYVKLPEGSPFAFSSKKKETSLSWWDFGHHALCFVVHPETLGPCSSPRLSKPAKSQAQTHSIWVGKWGSTIYRHNSSTKLATLPCSPALESSSIYNPHPRSQAEQSFTHGLHPHHFESIEMLIKEKSGSNNFIQPHVWWFIPPIYGEIGCGFLFSFNIF